MIQQESQLLVRFHVLFILIVPLAVVVSLWKSKRMVDSKKSVVTDVIIPIIGTNILTLLPTMIERTIFN